MFEIFGLVGGSVEWCEAATAKKWPKGTDAEAGRRQATEGD